ADLPEQLADDRRVLELLEHAWNPELRLVDAPEILRDGAVGCEIRSADRGECSAMASLEQRLVRCPLHQRVTPVEQNCPQHAVRLTAWRAGSCGDPLCSRPSRLRRACSAPVTSRCS